jgi:hypothetical protein
MSLVLRFALAILLCTAAAAQGPKKPLPVPEQLFDVFWVPSKEAIGSARVYRPESHPLGTLASLGGRRGFQLRRDGTLTIHPPLEDFGLRQKPADSTTPVIRRWTLARSNQLETTSDEPGTGVVVCQIVSISEDRLLLRGGTAAVIVNVDKLNKLR